MTILDEIVKHKQKEIETLPTQQAVEPSQHDFLGSFKTKPLSIIAEIKRKSPSEGMIVDNFDPIKIAQQYQQGGADAISVLTDEKYFAGSFDYLKQVRSAVDLPLLCKDFIIDECQVLNARAHGADACLLIAAVLTQEQLAHLKQQVESLNMTALIEIFDEEDLQKTLKVNPQVIGINNRNLKDFSVDMNNTNKLTQLIPESIPVISFSGVKEPQQIKTLPAQIKGVLVGTALMKSPDPVKFLEAMR